MTDTVDLPPLPREWNWDDLAKLGREVDEAAVLLYGPEIAARMKVAGFVLREMPAILRAYGAECVRKAGEHQRTGEMTAPELPPLPDLAVNLDSHAAQELAETGRCHEAFVCSYGVGGDLHLFTADQMRAYGLECARMAREAEREMAARECEKIAWGWDEQRSFAAIAHDCAAAIRKAPSEIGRSTQGGK